MSLTTAITFNMLGSLTHHRTGIHTFIYQSSTQSNRDERFAIVLSSSHKQKIIATFATKLESDVFHLIGRHFCTDRSHIYPIDLTDVCLDIFFNSLGFFGHESIHLLFQLLVFFHHLADSLSNVAGVVEHRFDIGQSIFQSIGIIFHHFGGDSFDTTDTSSDRTFILNTESTDTTGVADMCTTTKFHRFAITNHADFVAILFTKERHSTQRASLSDRHIAMFVQIDASTDLGIYLVFHQTNFFFAKFLEMREVETQESIIYIRTFLFYVRTQHFAQSFVQEVSSRVVGRNLGTTRRIHHSLESCCRIFGHRIDNMYTQIVFFLHITNSDFLAIGFEITHIANLTTHFSIERSTI